MQKKLGPCITKAKPYYESLKLTERLQLETQRAVEEFQRANSLYKTAKETLSVAEHSLSAGEIPDAWQEHLSVTITKINISKKAADQAEEWHRKKTHEYQLAEQKSQYLEKELKRHIAKSQ
jgi:SH3-domain binding protein 5